MNFEPVAYVTVIAVLVVVVVGLLIWLVVLLARLKRIIDANLAVRANQSAKPNPVARRKSTSSPDQGTSTTSPAVRRRSVTARIMVGMSVVSIAFVAIIVAVGMAGDGNQTLALPLLLIAGVVIFLSALAALVVIFVRNGLSNRNYALGLPDGSIRAIIALSLILLFAILAVFLYIGQGGFGTTQPTAAQTDIAKQLVTTLSTLVVAIASFYFGSTTVREAKKPDSEIPAVPIAPPPPPT